jgi:hypothetical protein
MKKSVFVFLGLGALLLAGCASAPKGGNPPEISKWISDHQNSDDMWYATGISEFQNESDAMQQALMLARENLAASLETQVAAIGSNAVQRAEAQGQTDRVARFRDSTKQIVDQTLRNVKTFGPFTNDKGNTSVVAYLDKQSFNKDVNAYVDQIFAQTDAELNQILGLDSNN